MIKKLSLGAYLSCAAVILAVVGVIAYVVNTGTNYYAKMGVDSTVIVCLIIAAVLIAARIVIGMIMDKPMWADILPVASAVFSVVGFMFLVNARVNNLAAVFTYENNAANMADTTSCIIAIACALITVILSIVAAFFDVTKE